MKIKEMEYFKNIVKGHFRYEMFQKYSRNITDKNFKGRILSK